MIRTFLSSTNKIIWAGLGFLVLLIGGIYLIFWLFAKPLDAWSLMPPNPVLVLESDQWLDTYQELQSTSLGQMMKNTPFGQQLEGRLRYLAGVNATSALSFFQNKKITLGLYLTAKEDLDLIFFFPLKKNADKELYQRVILNLKNDPQYQFKSYNLRDFNFFEVVDQESQQAFTYTIYEDYLIGSDATILVEDVIRTISTQEAAFSSTQLEKLDNFQEVALNQKNSARAYVNNQQFAKLLEVFMDASLGTYFKPIGELTEHILLNVKNQGDWLSWEGLSYPEREGNRSFLNIFKDQTPGGFTLKNFVPNDAAVLCYLNYSDPNRFFTSIKDYCQQENPSFLDRQEKIKRRFGFDSNVFYNNLRDEIGLCFLKSSKVGRLDKLLFCKPTSLPNLLNQLQPVSISAELPSQALGTGDASANYPVRQLSIDYFPSLLLGNFAQDFLETYYVAIGPYVVFGNNLPAMQTLIQQIKYNRVWGKSPNHRYLSEQIQPNANVNVVIDLNNAWSIFRQYASPTWRELLSRYENQLNVFQHLVAQVKPQGDQFATQVYLKTARPQVSSTYSPNQNQMLFDNALSSAIFTAPHLVKNHQDNSLEILLQDFNHNVYLMGTDGQVRWQRTVGSPIRSGPYQIDIFRNGKLQYLFATSDRVSLLDRLARDVPRFPIYIKEKNYWAYLHHWQAEGTGQHNFMVADRKGQVYMYDKERATQVGWRPKKLNSPLGSNVQHTRIAGKDYIFIPQQNGFLQVFDMEGYAPAGFPYQVGTGLSNPVVIDKGEDPSSTFVYCVSDEGKLFHLNLLGELQSEKPLEGTSPQTQFQFCLNQRSDDGLIAAIDPGFIRVWDKNAKKLFEKKLPTNSSKLEMQYFEFPNNIKIIALTNKIDSWTYLFDYRGQSFGQPFRSNKKVAIEYVPGREQIYVYRVHGSKIGKIAFQLK